MRHSEYRPSILTVEGSTAVPGNLLSLVCLTCGDTMKAVREIPKLEGHPGLLVLKCPSCNEVETKRMWGKTRILQNTPI
jgi:hypothetical protein